ncbi:MAG: hypothetical protein AAF789_05265 [Bacteroidota bacterium]
MHLILRRMELFLTTNFKISFTTALYENLRISNTGANYLQSRHCFSSELTLSYYKHISNNFGVNVGAGIGVAPFNLDFYLEYPENSLFFDIGFFNDIFLTDYYYLNFTWVFPVSVQKVIPKGDRTFYAFEVGSKLNWVVAFPYELRTEFLIGVEEEGAMVDYDLFIFEMDDNGYQFLVSYFTKIGLIKKNKKSK